MSGPTGAAPGARRGVGAVLRAVALALAVAFAVGFGIGTWLRCRMERAPGYIGGAPPERPIRVAAAPPDREADALP